MVDEVGIDNMKKWIGFFCIAFLLMISSNVVCAGDYYNGQIRMEEQYGWIEDHNGWWYCNIDGSYPKNEWELIEGKWYWFDYYGYRVEGWLKQGNTWYYLKPDTGVMTTGWATIDEEKYFFVSNGSMQTGWVAINNKWYYFASSGSMQTGWINVLGKWYYINPGNGVMQAGWIELEEECYYLSSNGSMQTGWQLMEDNWMYFHPVKGRLETSMWISGRYYVDVDGIMVTYCYIYDSEKGDYYWVNSDGLYESKWTTKIRPEKYRCIDQNTGTVI